MDFEGLYRRTKTGDCDSYYCSNCGGQSGRVEKALKRTSIDDVYNYLMDIDNMQTELEKEIDRTLRFSKVKMGLSTVSFIAQFIIVLWIVLTQLPNATDAVLPLWWIVLAIMIF